MPARVELDILAKQGSSSFLKKRTKKLLIIACSYVPRHVASVRPATDKSFLVLFFKKELLLRARLGLEVEHFIATC
jgi:hypothetical protein